MRRLADLQRDPEQPTPVEPAALPLDVQRERTFDTPEFAGMRFLEVEAKSALNKVNGMPFGWSINPYRGCSHACTYCLAGDTPVLMADSRTRPIADVRPGDAVCGTRGRGSSRRRVTTRVLDQWQTRKPAYRVVLADGTELVASGDHRFLTEDGWKHVTGAQEGPQRPHLTTADALVGAGSIATLSREVSADRRGPAVVSRGGAAVVPERGSAEASRGGAAAVSRGGAAVVSQRAVEPQAGGCRGPLEVVALESLGVEIPMFDLTTGTGDFIANGVVSHNCFARPSHSYLNLSPAEDFERTVVVKTNISAVLRRELAKPSWHGEHVAMGTNTDPYQRCEGRYRLMPGIVDALTDGMTPFSILTKGTMITRDVDRLTAAAEKVPVTAAFTVGMLDEAVWRDAEPGTPSPAARLEAVRRLNDAGIPTGVMVAPIMPGLNDDWEQLAAVVDAAAAAGATHITPIVLHLRPGVREVFWPWLTSQHPELVERYAQLYQKATADRAYREPLETFVAEQRRAAWDRHGWPASPPAWRGPRRSGRGNGESSAGSGPEQLSLL